MADFMIMTRLEPPHEHAAQLRAWQPGASLFPDFAVLTSGKVHVHLNNQAIAVVNNKLVAQTDPTAQNTLVVDPHWLPDYVGGFVQNLVTAAANLAHIRDDHEVEAPFVDEPLTFCFAHSGTGFVRVTLRANDGSGTHFGAQIAATTFYRVIATVADSFLSSLRAINPALLEHPAVTMIVHAKAGLPLK